MAPFFGDLIQSEKPSEINPPLVEAVTSIYDRVNHFVAQQVLMCVVANHGQVKGGDIAVPW